MIQGIFQEILNTIHMVLLQQRMIKEIIFKYAKMILD